MRIGLGEPARRPVSDSSPKTWFLVEAGFEPAREHEVESLFTVANGYVGTRGSLQEGSRLSSPATFLAGVFNMPADSDSISELVVAPEWARIRVFVEGQELRLTRGTTLEHRRKLDTRRGLLDRVWRHKDSAGRVTSLHFVRFVSLADRHVLVERLTLTPENYSGHVRAEIIVDGRVTNTPNVKHLETTDAMPQAMWHKLTPLSSERRLLPLLMRRTTASGLVLTFALASEFRPEPDELAEPVLLGNEEWVGERWEWEAEIGLTYHVDKLVTAYTSRDGQEPGRLAADHRANLLGTGADRLLEEHVKAWADRWAAADSEIEGNSADQRAIRFAIYHLIASANPEDERVSIGARDLTGESYKGHVFWDTEIYMLPFYVFTHPPSARALLMYRYHTLPGARAKAQTVGYRGALYPWESTDTGEEASPSWAITPEGEVVRILTGEQEHHISADVAYAVWQYWQATGDDRFFQQAGAEMMVETARFWASRVHLEDDGRYHIHKVIGPDEYHEGVDDNAFTNGMAQWNLERGVETAQFLMKHWPERWEDLASRIGITAGELTEWHEISQRMYTGFDPATGLIEQFRGYFDLDYVDLSAYERRTAPMDVLLGHERTAQTQIIKQPDVVMLIYLLWDRFPAKVRAANFRYYEPRCGHGSSLSPSIHSLVAARLGDRALAARYFRQAAEIDLANNMGNAAGGVHSAAQGGLWQTLAFGFAGMRLREDGLSFDPHLPSRWRALSFPIQWRGRLLRVSCEATPPALSIQLKQGIPMAVTIGEADGARIMMEVAKQYRIEREKGTWRQWREMPR